MVPLAGDYSPKGEPKRLTSDNLGTRSPAWSADGREVIFVSMRGGSRGLWRIDAAGSQPPRPLAVAGQAFYQVAISRQGHRLAYARFANERDIWRFDLPQVGAKAGPAVSLISSTAYDQRPQFSPDGKRIAFASERSGNWEIWLCGSDGTNLVQLTSFGGPHTGAPSWSPDGSQIAFDSRPEGNTDIFVVGANGGKLRRLTTDPAQDLTPAWSHDGKWVYFGSNRSGQFQIWKVPAGRGEAVQVTRNGGLFALESPDGKFLYYAKENGPPSLWRVSVAGGEEVQVLESLHWWPNFQVTEDGIYHVASPISRNQYRVGFYRFADRKTEAIATVDKLPFGLAVSPDRRVMLCALTEEGSDLMLVENFR